MSLRENIHRGIHPELSWRLDLARALAAGLVLFGHLRISLLPAWRDLGPEYRDIANYVLFFMTRMGHEAVMIFFVLSGFLVGGNALSKHVEGRFSLREYMSNRLTRMYVVLLPTLALGGLLDVWRVSIVGQIDSSTHFGWSVFAGNLFFLQTIVVETFGRNAPLWSLAYEFWYYVMWGLLVWSLSWRTKTILKVAFAAVLILLGIVSIPHIMKLFPVWLMGVMVRCCPAFFRSRLWLLPLSGGVIICAAIANMMGGNYIGEVMIGLAFSGLIWHWMFTPLKSHATCAVLSRFFAAFSFSLYAIHFPILKWLTEAVKMYGIQIPLSGANLKDWGILLTLGILIYSIAWLFYLGTEKHTSSIRKKIAKIGIWQMPVIAQIANKI